MQPRPLGSCAGDRVIRVDVLFKNRPSLAGRILAAFPDLVFDGDGGLAITTESSVNGAAKVHSVPLADGLHFFSNCATDGTSFAICFESWFARNSRASAGMITRSAHSRSAGSSFAPSLCLPVSRSLNCSLHSLPISVNGQPSLVPGCGDFRNSPATQLSLDRALFMTREPCRLEDAGFSRMSNWRWRCMGSYLVSDWTDSPFEIAS